MTELDKRPLSVLIVDDEPLARTRLAALLGDLRDRLPTRICGECASGKEALARIEADAPEVVLLDVQMPGMNGIEVARHAAHIQPWAPVVIFSTAHDEFALQAFEVQAIDYLVKPVRAERLADALVRARQRISEREAAHRHADSPPPADALSKAAALTGMARKHIAVSERGKLHLVPVADIVYLRAELKYTTIRTGEREYLSEESLSALEAEFPEVFVRIHRNALVARAAIAGSVRGAAEGEDAESVEPGWSVVLRGVKETLPVSRRQWPGVKALLKA